jgi:nitrite reductase (NADH) small subunit
MMSELSTQEQFKRGAPDAGRYFAFMSDFVGLSLEHAEAIRETRFVIEKHIPAIIGEFYAQVLSFPATRKHFLKPDGTLDQDYLELRMQHQAGFWRRTASGVFDEDYARFVDYVGRAHTSLGADPTVYIPERYVLGMVGFVGQRVTQALAAELREVDPDLEERARTAWQALLMVLLEQLARPYGEGREPETFQAREAMDEEPVRDLAVETYEKALGIARTIEYREVAVGTVDEIPEGQRKIIDAEGLSIGVFHQEGEWVALQNSCLHRGGPVCAGDLANGTLTCPWHGYQYALATGQLLLDRTAVLPKYPVTVRDGRVTVLVPVYRRDEADVSLAGMFGTSSQPPAGGANLFRVADLQPGQVTRVTVDGINVAVYNVAGQFYATQDECTHTGGPLSQGKLDETIIVCPWHASCFDVTTGEVLPGPAKTRLRTYHVAVDGEVGRVETAGALEAV